MKRGWSQWIWQRRIVKLSVLEDGPGLPWGCPGASPESRHSGVVILWQQLLSGLLVGRASTFGDLVTYVSRRQHATRKLSRCNARNRKLYNTIRSSHHSQRPRLLFRLTRPHLTAATLRHFRVRASFSFCAASSAKHTPFACLTRTAPGHLLTRPCGSEALTANRPCFEDVDLCLAHCFWPAWPGRTAHIVDPSVSDCWFAGLPSPPAPSALAVSSAA